ncbi:MAG TPA: hypothetical protein VI756_07785 [Blastocatellia bacterium]
MMDAEVREVLEKLLSKSNAGQVNWLPAGETDVGPVSEDDYVVSLPNSSINVYRSPKGLIYVSILNDEGTVIAKFGGDEADEDQNLIYQLLESAKRKALNFKSTLRAIKRFLESDKPLGLAPRAQEISDDDVPL